MKKEKGVGLVPFLVIVGIILAVGIAAIALIITKNNKKPEETNTNTNPFANIIETPTNNTTNETNNNTTSTVTGGTRYTKDTNIAVGGKVVSIPAGATLSGIKGEYESVEDGVVIYIIPKTDNIKNWNDDSDGNGIKDVQEKYDQFVWIPVEDAIAEDRNSDEKVDATDIKQMIQEKKYPMAIKIDGTNDYRAILYDFELNEESKEVKVTPKEWSTTLTSYREPAYLTESTKGDSTTYNDAGITSASLQEEFNKMVEKVEKQKGFWVGRYETSNMKRETEDDQTNQIKIVRGTTDGISNVNWYRMYAQQKNYSTLAGLAKTSSIIWGSQWDQMMIFMKDVKNINKNNSYYVVDSIGMGNYGVDASGKEKTEKQIELTGSTDKYKVKNIFDLAGNVYDWTLEATVTENRVKRGSFYYETTILSINAQNRNQDYPIYGQTAIGSRAVLY